MKKLACMADRERERAVSCFTLSFHVFMSITP